MRRAICEVMPLQEPSLYGKVPIKVEMTPELMCVEKKIIGQ